MLQIKDIMMKSEKLRASAQNNTERDFEFAYFDNIDDALVEGLEQNQDFFSLLLDNDEIKRQVLGIFAADVYNELKGNRQTKVLYPELGKQDELQAAESGAEYGK